MHDLLLSVQPSVPVGDDSELPFPAGTPYKGVVHSRDFITGSQLASRIGLTTGTSVNNEAGWLHFVEDNGYNIYIAKKPLRIGATWTQINTAQTGKEIVLNGKTFLVEFMTGMKANGLAYTVANGGGQWDRYMYNIYGGERANQLPATRENWGSYTEKMLGIPLVAETQNGNALPNGGFSYTKDTVSGGGHSARGMCYPVTNTVPNIMGVWYTTDTNVEPLYGWRPMLVEKGTFPPQPVTPYKGLIQPADLISAADLSTMVGLSEGSIVPGAGQWMKFIDNGKELYIAQKTFRGSVRKKTLDAIGIGNAAAGIPVTIGGKNYRCRLLTSAEWDRYMYSVYDNSYVTVNTNFWASYSNTDLCVATGGATIGTLSYVYGGSTRGFTSISGSWAIADWADNGTPVPGYGWRPVLELVP